MKNFYKERFAETSDSTEEVVVAATPPIPTEQWWYVRESTKNGPVDVEQIKGLSANTLVWKTGMADWTTVARIFPPTSPPPIPAEEINQMAVWFWSLSPLWLLLTPRITVIELGQLGIFGVPLAINSVFYAWDLHLIRKSGRENDFWGSVTMFLPPIPSLVAHLACFDREACCCCRVHLLCDLIWDGLIPPFVYL